MLKNAKQFAELAVQPVNWTNLLAFAGAMLVVVADEDSKLLTFSIGWLAATLLAFLPSLFSDSWKNCSTAYRKADRTLAYCEGWRRSLASLQAFSEMPRSETTEESRKESVDSDFKEGLAYVESGMHMRIR
jgi:hypothetical protein